MTPRGGLRSTLLCALSLVASGCVLEVLNGYSINTESKQIVAGFANVSLKDATGAIAGGLSRIRLRPSAGSTRVDVSSKRVALPMPEPGPFRMTIALPDHDGGSQCATATVDLVRRGKTLRFP